MKMEETVAKFEDIRQLYDWEIVENYETWDHYTYVEGKLAEPLYKKPCEHAIDVVDEEDWRREILGELYVLRILKWKIPRVIRAREDSYHCTVVCLDCLLKGISEHYG